MTAPQVPRDTVLRSKVRSKGFGAVSAAATFTKLPVLVPKLPDLEKKTERLRADAENSK